MSAPVDVFPSLPFAHIFTGSELLAQAHCHLSTPSHPHPLVFTSPSICELHYSPSPAHQFRLCFRPDWERRPRVLAGHFHQPGWVSFVWGSQTKLQPGVIDGRTSPLRSPKSLILGLFVILLVLSESWLHSIKGPEHKNGSERLRWNILFLCKAALGTKLCGRYHSFIPFQRVLH